MTARILVIEDNKANLELVRYLLTFNKYTVLEACNGVDGLEVARRERPDLILCDLQMPLLDGYEVLAALRSGPDAAQVTVVAVTAFSMPNDQSRVMAAGFDGYLSKPIDPERFVNQIEAYLPLGLRNTRPSTDP